MYRLKTDLKMWINNPLRFKLIYTLINVGIPLAVGGLIYFLFVPTADISKWLYNTLGCFRVETGIDLTGSFVTCYLADFLWAYALFNVVSVIQVNTVIDFAYVFIETILLVCIIETLQLTPLLNGTFDVFDIFVEVSGIMTAFIVIIIVGEIRRRNDSYETKGA